MNPLSRSILRLAAVSSFIWLLAAGVAAAQSADLEIQKWTFADPAAANATVSYFMMVFNNGPDPAPNVVVTDVLPPDTTFQLALPDAFNPAACSFDAATRTVTCTVSQLDAYDSAFFQIDVKAPPYEGSITNTATVTSSATDGNPDNNSSSVTTPVVVFNLSDLAVTTTASASSVLVHRAVTFTTTVTNNGPHDAAGVELTLNPPFLADITSLTSSQGSCTVSNSFGDLDCLLGPLAVGASATVTLEVKPQKDGFALLVAFVSGYGDPGFLDPNSSNDFAHVVVDVNYPGNAAPAYSQTTSQVIPYSTLIYNPCTEDILSLDGTIRQVVSIMENNHHFSTNAYTNYSDLSAVGLLSGTSYTIHGSSRTGSDLNLNFGGWWPREVTTNDTLTLVGDDGTTLQLHENTHITINADGSYTSLVDNPTLTCR